MISVTLNDYTQSADNSVMIESEHCGDVVRHAEMTCSASDVDAGNRLQFADVRDASQQGKKKGDIFNMRIFAL